MSELTTAQAAEVERVKAKRDQALHVVFKLANNPNDFSMSIPVNRDRDDDCILVDAIHAVDPLIETIQALRDELAAMTQKYEDATEAAITANDEGADLCRVNDLMCAEQARLNEALAAMTARAERNGRIANGYWERSEDMWRERDEARQMAADGYTALEKTLEGMRVALRFGDRDHIMAVFAPLNNNGLDLIAAYKAAEKALGPVGDAPKTLDAVLTPELHALAREMEADTERQREATTEARM